MAKTFGDAERHILSFFNVGATFTYADVRYTVTKSGKPTCSKGEPKTDIYIAAEDIHHNIAEFKISFKKQNADFLENKTNAERAEQLFGSDWENIISNATTALQDKFLSRMLIYKEKLGRTDKGAITLGWKFELLNVESGQLSGNMQLTQDQIIDVYAGTNLKGDKRDATVNGEQIPFSGVANYILFENTPVNSTQEAINSLISIEDYVDSHPDVYFACKALNYRTFREKYDGNRPLAVYVDWSAKNGKLGYKIQFDTPLKQGGDYAYERLKTAMDLLGVKTTDDLDDSNVEDPNKIHK
ncbi:hypothetical protein SAMN05216520_10499 [Kandleria vitulina]|uniref:hypothetical protein n=1 Tax=Kandleria vitulina TaxID=1630 RepID=UPI00087E03BE|nr:hypothetical protein [Kandleria vitulina]SDL35920.1 hypothetical protein SAMN05216520_10499 [Kandleria vitulina]